eukprot:TRINITY_DN8678_c0_g1_i2.p1 TRINITY_DN8678_c0_g1~~TRINITY_DN8678_c0_g1_i2.p1  ORF type:complete len:632 (-),score=110.60 TRINITY_DN8678_c0_g1_i2:24-1874(-)
MAASMSRSTEEICMDRFLEVYDPMMMDAFAFCLELQLSVETLGIQAASRSYRNDFAHRHRAILEGADTWYLPELYEVCMSEDPQVIINGTVYHLRGGNITNQSDVLRRCLTKLFHMLECWNPVTAKEASPDLRSTLIKLDSAWADFELYYVLELMAIEAQARQPILTAVSLELELHNLECLEDPGTSISDAATILNVLTFDDKNTLDGSGQQVSLTSVPKQHQSAVAHSSCSLRHQAFETVGSLSKERQSLEDGSPSAAQSPFTGQITEVHFPDLRNCPLASMHRRTCARDIHWLAGSATAFGTSSTRRRALQSLVAQVASLNACANIRGKGRQDLTFEVLEAAADVFLFPETSTGITLKEHSFIRASSAARHLLAARVLDGFLGLRNYLAEIADCADTLDAQLSNNDALVERLLAWEQAWEQGSQFMLRPALLEAVCSISAQISEALHFAPDLAKHLEDQSAELFLILPRLVLLCGLLEPSQAVLIENLLPHHFVSNAEDQTIITLRAVRLSSEMMDLAKGLDAALSAISVSRPSTAWEVLVRSAVAGLGSTNSLEFDSSVDCFLHRLEAVSMELQRAAPEAWNCCCSVLVQCVEAASAPRSMSLGSSACTIFGT